MQTASLPEPQPSSRASKLLYQPLDFVVVRAPLLPVESYCSCADEDNLLSPFYEPAIQRALAVGSSSLLTTFERFNKKGLNPRDTELMRAKLLRYRIRMSTRPTPFGIFAGVALGSWGTMTDLVVKSTCAVTRTRPDMAWLMAFVSSVEANATVRKRLSYYANPLSVIEAGRVTLAERMPTAKGGTGPPVSVRATGAVKRALSLAKKPILYDELVVQLCDAIPSATPAKVEKLLTELWEQTFLLTDLRPPLTIESPGRYVAGRLANIPEAADDLKRLDAFLAAASSWDQMQPEQSLEAFGALLDLAGVSPDKSRDNPIQVDTAMSVEGHMGDSISIDAALAAELLLRLTPMPFGLPTLAAYRQAFLNRYGHDREVPLLLLLDPQRGLGPPAGHGHGAELNVDKANQRAQTLLRLACTALHKRERTVHLDQTCLARLETWQPNTETAPRTLDINILVAARSVAAINSGEYAVVVGPNLGAMAAGRNLGRFADMLGPHGLKALKKIADEEQAHDPEQLSAELVYLPSNFRSANVVIRPAVRSYEIPLGVSPGVPASQVIPLDELVVGVDRNCFYVYWPAAGKRVMFSSGNMLNLHNAPPVGRFLVDLSNDGKAVFSTFDWGMVESFPYLPRVQVGRIVLRLAQWRINKDDIVIETTAAYRSSVDSWRATWDVPRHVFLSVGDNRLIIDLDQDSQAAELKAELKKLPDGGSLIVQEVLPQLDETWLPGPNGHYYSEFTVSLSLHAHKPASVQRGVAQTEVESPSLPAVTHVSEQTLTQTKRTYPPGSEWLFVKLYCPRNLEDDVISGSMLTFAENALASGLADSWFFIRYSDPEAHLRLRFHGAPERLTRQLFGHVCEWASGLIAEGIFLKSVFDTYEQEVERFGGPAGMALAERFFSMDSRYAAELLRHYNAKQWLHDRSTMVAISIDDLLGAIGLSEAERLRWYSSQATLGRTQTSDEYRQRKNVLRALLGKPDFLATEPGGGEIARVFRDRQKALADVVDTLRKLGSAGELGQSFDTLCASFVHLHVNRLNSTDSLSEQWLLSLLHRTREGLKKAPATPNT